MLLCRGGKQLGGWHAGFGRAHFTVIDHMQQGPGGRLEIGKQKIIIQKKPPGFVNENKQVKLPRLEHL